MYIITVEYVINPGHMLTFMDAVLENAESSLHKEEGCVQFDVSQSHDNPTHFFLYEQFEDEIAFQQHVESEHYLAFSKKIQKAVVTKTVRHWYSC